MSKEPQIRKPKPRHYDVIFGAIEERVSILEVIARIDTVTGDATRELPFEPHLLRLHELLDELRRYIKGQNNE